MKIRELYIRGFGKFRDTRIPLSDGINLIRGENESGKSTLHAFIRGMLFGQRRLRGRASRNDDHRRYAPWDHPASYGGELRFESGGKLFRISRDFAGSREAVRLVCESDGEELSPEGGDLEVLLGGVSETVFDNTVSVGQLQSVTGEALARELNNYMTGYQGAADLTLDLKKAEERLKQQRKNREARLQEIREEQEAEQRELRSGISFLRKEIERIRQDLEEAAENSRQEERGERSPEKTSASGVWGRRGLAAALILLAFGSLAFFREPALPLWLGRAGALLAAAVLFLGSLKKQVLSKETDRKAPEGRGEYLRRELEEKERALENAENEYREYCNACGKKDPLETDLEALVLADQVIRQLSAGLRKKAGGSLRQKMSGLLRELTGGRYREVSMNEELAITLRGPEGDVPLNRVSRGTVEQVYLSLRLAAAELLCPEEELPLLLDEPFALYDDRRLCRGLETLAEQGRQVLLFTCQDREEQWLKMRKIPYHKVVLQEEHTEC